MFARVFASELSGPALPGPALPCGVLTGVLTAALALGAPAVLAKGGGGRAPAGPPPVVESSVLTSMPVKELTVFKDGHAFVFHESEMPTETTGDVVIDTLPTPVIGTFWAYSADPAARLRAVVAGTRRIKADRNALTTPDFIAANIGAEVFITDETGTYAATIVGLPQCKPDDADGGTPPGPAGVKPPQPGNLVLLRVQEGVKAAPIERISRVTFRDDPKLTLSEEEERKLLTMKLDWDGKPAAKSAKVGMYYLQRGVRWIPSYRVEIDGAGKAKVKLQATLINELVDLDDATAHLVIGVPSFYFKDTIDPIALQQTIAQLSQYFGQPGQSGQMQQYAFSNALMTQARARQSEYRAPDSTETSAIELDDPEITSASRNEDLFIFTVAHVSLRKGERMVVPVAEFDLTYEDVFSLEVPFSPPAEVQCNANPQQVAELARLLQQPKVMHRIRLANKSAYPLTTAPALILREGRLLAQSLMTYAPVGGAADLDLTTAVDISVAKSEQETKRTPQAERWGDNMYARFDLGGKLTLTNRRQSSARIEVTRYILGVADTADHEGVVAQTNMMEDPQLKTGGYPLWWHWYNWPYWWHRFNGVGRVQWKFELKPGESVELAYAWHYFWN
ncbi:hypothetical protein RAS1_17990 [Phycisphaerae bacterium RAS1]|nr:hypothetical protein RAS1_17990 [Phycisphaerae bacterium RAS1]